MGKGKPRDADEVTVVVAVVVAVVGPAAVGFEVGESEVTCWVGGVGYGVGRVRAL